MAIEKVKGTPEKNLEAFSKDLAVVQKTADQVSIIKTPEDLERAIAFGVEVKSKIKHWQGVIEFFTTPFKEARKKALEDMNKIEAMFAPTLNPLLSLEVKVKDAVNTFKREEEEKARKEEARLQKIRDEANAKREEKGEAPIMTPVKTVERTEQTISTGSGRATTTKSWKYRVTDINKVPRKFLRCEVVHATVMAEIKAGLREVEGLEIYEDYDTRITA